MNHSFCYQKCHEYQTWLETKEVQNRFSAPLPWVGLYVAGASAICLFVVTADAIQGFCYRKLWIPCKVFAINAASLTILAVAVKLAMDLTSSTPSLGGQLIKLSSIVLLCTAMAYLMPSLASMNNTDLLVNVAALAIFVVTLSVNAVIQICTGLIQLRGQNALALLLILFQVVIMTFSALTVPTTRRILELKYKELYKAAFDERKEKHANLAIEKLEEHVRICWVMAETGSPQFVMARSVTSSTSVFICISCVITLMEATISGPSTYYNHPTAMINLGSDYKWSIIPIFLIQYLFIFISTTILAFRFWFTATNFREQRIKNFGDVFKIEHYWTQSLRDWREKPIAFPVRCRRCRKVLQGARNLILSLCIMVQIEIILLSKLLHLISSLFLVLLWLCFHNLGRLKNKSMEKLDFQSSEPKPTAREPDLRPYALLLEGEAEVPERALKNFYSSASDFIRKAKRKCPRNLKELLLKSISYKGISEFDSDEIPWITSEEPPNCWTLPIVTLTSIAISLPNISYHLRNRLLRSVAEGFSYAHLVEKNPDMNQKITHVSDAADVVWDGIDLYGKWLDKNLQKMALEAKSSVETLQSLACMAEEIITGFKTKLAGNLMENPLNWPTKLIAANSLYRITRTLLLDYRNIHHRTDEGLFEEICIKIADIFAACLSNLPLVITMKCDGSCIEDREKNVREAACLLGETEDILRVLMERDIPSLQPHQAMYIDEWRLLLKQDVGSERGSTTASCVMDIQDVELGQEQIYREWKGK